MTVCGIPINEEYGTLALTVRSFNSAAETAHTVTAAWIHCSRLQKDNKSIVQPPISAQERSWMTDKWLICLYLRREQWKFKGTIDCPKTIAGIASALFLFIVIIGIIVCCFLCSCCYLYRRRHQLREQFAGPREVVHSYPMHPAYPSNVSPGMQAPYPTAPAYGAAGIHNRTKKYNRMNEKLHTKTDKLCKYRRNKLSQRFSELPTEPSLPTQHTSWIVSSIPDSPSLQCYNCSATVLVRKRECCAFPDAVSMCAISWQQACSRTRFPRIPSLFAVDGLQ
ncbi:protein shisa-4 isoform X2 [Hypanus sabinus]|uniref:protein shisa-4 isoform X2 n=2 Tax=Hypanus sabinus TaxID=79690 RepID=UPI0028C47A4F|nr:protein shisa-4 isoform X2 [Hypanus sabinus]XP_059806498.1 protein shisa-4 isoform X2 [Hypanus sabinus]